MHFADKVELMGLIRDINDSIEVLYTKIQQAVIQAEKRGPKTQSQIEAAPVLKQQMDESIQALTTLKFELARHHRSLWEALEKEFGRLDG